jgi:hypothetical protein
VPKFHAQVSKSSWGEVLSLLHGFVKEIDGRTEISEDISRDSECRRIFQKVQGSYRIRGRGSKLRKKRDHGFVLREPSDLHVASHIGSSRVRAPKYFNKSHEVARGDIPIVRNSCGTTSYSGATRGIGIS